MPLNQSQLLTLINVIHEVIDGLSPELLTKAIEPVSISLSNAIDILRLEKNRNLIPQTSSDEIKIPPEVPTEWKKILEGSVTTLPDFLKINPNFNPICVAEMQRFEDNLSVGISEETKLQLLRLRELYLEMTPRSEYSYGETYLTFYFRIGKVPLNLDTFGDTPAQGDIQEIVTTLTKKDIAVKQEHEQKEKEIQRGHKRKFEELEKEYETIKADRPIYVVRRRRLSIFEELDFRNIDLVLEEKDIWPVSKSAERFDTWMKSYTGHNGTHNEELVDWLSCDSGIMHVKDYAQFCDLALALQTKGYSTVPPPSKSEFECGVSEYTKKCSYRCTF